MVEILEVVKDYYYFNKYFGIVCVFKNLGLGVGVFDIGRCKIKIIDGKVYIRIFVVCIG